MIIDAHTHIYPEQLAKKAIPLIIEKTNGHLTAYTDGTYDGLLASMDKSGVDYSIVLTVATNIAQGRKNLQWLQKMIGLSSRLIFFGSIHPHDPDYKTLLSELKALGIKGLKFHPPYQNFPVDSKDVYPVYEEAIKNGFILHFHSGFDMSIPDSDTATVERMSHFVRDFKGAKIILAHGGDQRDWKIVLDLMGDKKCYYDTSFALEKMLKDPYAIELFRQNEDYFVFGTDSPWRDQKHFIELINNSDLFSAEQKEKLFYKNISKLISLK